MTPEDGRDGGVCRNDAGGGRNGGVCRDDGGGMSQGIFPWRIRVPVFFLTRLCANAEIGVPREELHVSDVASVPAVVSALSVIPPPPPVIPAKAGILTRGAISKGSAIVANYAAIPSRHISYGKGDGLCVLKSLVWIRAI